MNTSVKRKNIDIPVDILQNLAVKAALAGKSVKSYIESLVIKDAEMTDEVLYAHLLKQDPDGQVYLTQQEQEAFEKEMGL